MSILLLIIRYFLSLVFLLSSCSKITAPRKFAYSVQKYRILPPLVARLYAYFLAYFEVLIGISLLFGWLPALTGLATALILLSFMMAISIVLIRKQSLECGCFGLLYREKIKPATLGRDGILLIMAIAFGIWGHLAPPLPDIINGGYFPERSISLVFFGLMLLGLYTSGRQIIAAEMKRRYLIRAQSQLTAWAQK